MSGARVTGAHLCCLIVVVLAATCSSCRSYELESKDDIVHHCRHFMEKHLGNGDPHFQGRVLQVREASQRRGDLPRVLGG
ncbi:hypothetical protein PVAP13_3KG189227 [Panicum virgatum]|uniref:Secreted protein n=1 Tax=Panicum virgatum TaxID=38727 RepID=A0A8T0UWL2_PANVG|nr:hypothetical protein PVAP13_3KG189227 [Panicum virgatum]